MCLCAPLLILVNPFLDEVGNHLDFVLSAKPKQALTLVLILALAGSFPLCSAGDMGEDRGSELFF